MSKILSILLLKTVQFQIVTSARKRNDLFQNKPSTSICHQLQIFKEDRFSSHVFHDVLLTSPWKFRNEWWKTCSVLVVKLYESRTSIRRSHTAIPMTKRLRSIKHFYSNEKSRWRGKTRNHFCKLKINLLGKRN